MRKSSPCCLLVSVVVFGVFMFCLAGCGGPETGLAPVQEEALNEPIIPYGCASSSPMDADFTGEALATDLYVDELAYDPVRAEVQSYDYTELTDFMHMASLTPLSVGTAAAVVGDTADWVWDSGRWYRRHFIHNEDKAHTATWGAWTYVRSSAGRNGGYHYTTKNQTGKTFRWSPPYVPANWTVTIVPFIPKAHHSNSTRVMYQVYSHNGDRLVGSAYVNQAATKGREVWLGNKNWRSASGLLVVRLRDSGKESAKSVTADYMKFAWEATACRHACERAWNAVGTPGKPRYCQEQVSKWSNRRVGASTAIAAMQHFRNRKVFRAARPGALPVNTPMGSWVFYSASGYSAGHVGIHTFNPRTGTQGIVHQGTSGVLFHSTGLLGQGVTYLGYVTWEDVFNNTNSW